MLKENCMKYVDHLCIILGYSGALIYLIGNGCIYLQISAHG